MLCSFFLYSDVDLRVEVSKVRVLMLDHIVLVMTTCCLPFFASNGRDWSALNVVMLCWSKQASSTGRREDAAAGPACGCFFVLVFAPLFNRVCVCVLRFCHWGNHNWCIVVDSAPLFNCV